MSSKAEKTSHYSAQQPQLSIFLRNPPLLKIVAWMGSLSFIGISGIAWADLKPISTSQAQAQEQVDSPGFASADTIATKGSGTYGPNLPVAPKQSPDRVTPEQLPNREVPIAVTPSSASILPTGKIIPPQHTDVLTADNYTVGVNGSADTRTTTEEFITIPIPAPLRAAIPSQTRETLSSSSSQVQPRYIKNQAIVSTSTPITDIQPKPRSSQLNNGDRAVPEVATLPTSTSTSARIDRGASSQTSTSVSPRSSTGNQRFATVTPQTSSTIVKHHVVTKMRPSVTTKTNPQPQITTPIARVSGPVQPRDSINISIPSPHTGRIEVQPVTQLPRIAETQLVPTVPAIPTVRPAAAGRSSSGEVTLINPGNQASSQLSYPLSSPAPTTSSFGWRMHPISGSRRFHSGLDLGAPMGAPVVAAGSGTIVTAGWLGGYGKAIVIEHNGIQQTLYGHLSEVFVKPGQRIEQGTVIGRVGSTGNSTGPHLHFETRVATSDGWIAVDPGEDMKYAVANLRRSMPFAQRDLPQEAQ
jgi:Peptidase family M23